MTTKLFVSACLSYETEGSNISRMRELLEDVRDNIDSAMYLPMRDVVGVWQGQVEASYEFTVSTLKQIDSLKRLAFGKYEQEAVLIVNGNGDAILHYADGLMQYVGQWRELDEDEDRPDCYSIINGVVYVCD